MTEHPATVLTGSWIELGTEREGLLQMLDENANFDGRPAAGRPHCKDWHCSLKGGQKTDDGTKGVGFLGGRISLCHAVPASLRKAVRRAGKALKRNDR
jgi:hypothetical protein